MRGGSGRRPGFGVVLAVVLVVSGACGRPAVVRGQRVDVSLHDFRIYTAPTSYSPNGLTFGPAPVALDAAVGNGGSGASFITKIGTATID